MKLHLRELESPDDFYLRIILSRIAVCKNYRPKFGQGQQNGLSLEQFQEMYRSDAFYNWLGLDNPLMYAAHKAAGGITSVYRQIGIGCEQVFQQVLQDHLGLSPEQSSWSYTTSLSANRLRKLALDGRITLADISSEQKLVNVKTWLREASRSLEVTPEVAAVMKGAVFEVRQGYKSKDSKRQNADIANAATAYTQGYLPVVMVLSSQIDSDIASRYQYEKWLVLRGTLEESSLLSTYAFCREVIGYDLAEFFKRNSPTIKAAIDEVLAALLATHD